MRYVCVTDAGDARRADPGADLANDVAPTAKSKLTDLANGFEPGRSGETTHWANQSSQASR